MSVEKAKQQVISCETGLFQSGNVDCPHDPECLDALIAEVRSEQVAHVANCLCHPVSHGVDGNVGNCDSEHPYADPRCKPLDLHDAEVRLEALELTKSTDRELSGNYANRMTSLRQEARAAVNKLKGRK